MTKKDNNLKTPSQLLDEGNLVVIATYLNSKVSDNEGVSQKSGQKYHIQTVHYNVLLGSDLATVECRPPRGKVMTPEELNGQASRFKPNQKVIVAVSSFKRGSLQEGGLIQLTATMENIFPVEG